MRSFSSRSVIQTVSALAIAGLMAGCGGSSSSLPSAGGSNGVTPAKQSTAAIFAQQLKTGIFPQSNLQVKQGTQAQYETMHNALAAQFHTASSGRTTKDFASGGPGGFGYVTNSATFGYSGISGTMSAYTTAQFHLPNLIISTPTAPGTITPALTRQKLIMPIVVPPGGQCLFAFAEYSSTQNGPNNNFGALDECQHRIFSTDMSDMATGLYTGGSNAQITFYEFNNTLYIFNGTQFVQYATSLNSNTSLASTVTGGNGGAFYVEEPLQPQPYGCPILPNQQGQPGNNTFGTNPGFPMQQPGTAPTTYNNSLFVSNLNLLTAQAPPNFSSTPVVQGNLSGGGQAAFYGPNGQTQTAGGAQPNATAPTTLTCFLHRPTPGSFTIAGFVQGGTPTYTANRIDAPAGSGFSVTSQSF